MLLPEIVINQLSKIYYSQPLTALKNKATNCGTSGKNALTGISLTIHSGEVIGIIGRNGSGKSTLLSIIAGISNLTSGEILVNGKVTAIMTLGIGLRDDLSGRENIYLDGEIQGKPRKIVDSLIDEIIEFSELEAFIDKPVKIYSTGMKSRLAFSMLVCIEPEILIIDEALSAGDAFFAIKASKKIQEICRKGKIVLIVSHSMATIESMCNRCLWLEQGHVVMDDKPAKVCNAYLTDIKKDNERHDRLRYQKDKIEVLDTAQYTINDVDFRVFGSDYPQRVFLTGDSIVLNIDIAVAKILDDVRLEIIIRRIDAALISRNKFDLKQNRIGDSSDQIKMCLELDSLFLNKGFYQLEILLFEQRWMTNVVIKSFEVNNNMHNNGGVPLLYYPADIILLNRELEECLDSSVMISE